MILFLDFDGVLHPDSVYMGSSGPLLRAPGALFMWASILESQLLQFADINIVLSTSWVRQLDFSRAKKKLPAALRERVVGSTWHSSMAKGWADQNWWDQASRYQQIMRYVNRTNTTQWLAVDDDGEGWNAAHRDKLVLTNPSTGISPQQVQAELTNKLKNLVPCDSQR